jgi:hypothetical protein
LGGGSRIELEGFSFGVGPIIFLSGFGVIPEATGDDGSSQNWQR